MKGLNGMSHVQVEQIPIALSPITTSHTAR